MSYFLKISAYFVPDILSLDNFRNFGVIRGRKLKITLGICINVRFTAIAFRTIKLNLLDLSHPPCNQTLLQRSLDNQYFLIKMTVFKINSFEKSKYVPSD